MPLWGRFSTCGRFPTGLPRASANAATAGCKPAAGWKPAPQSTGESTFTSRTLRYGSNRRARAGRPLRINTPVGVCNGVVGLGVRNLAQPCGAATDARGRLTITVDIAPEVEAGLAQQAAACGRAVEAHVASLLEDAVHLPPAHPPQDRPARQKRQRPPGRKSLAQLFADSPFRGLDLDFERDRDLGRDIEL